jgi:T-complex protein 1 subunit theta
LLRRYLPLRLSAAQYIKKIADCGVGAVIVSSTISALAMHYLEKYKIMCSKLMSKFELRRIAKCVGAKLIAQPNVFGPEDMGFCASIHVEEVGSHRVTVLRQSMQDTGVCTILVRGSTQNILNDIERAIDDGVNSVRAMGRDARFLAGAGGVEMELAKRLASCAELCPGLEQVWR